MTLDIHGEASVQVQSVEVGHDSGNGIPETSLCRGRLSFLKLGSSSSVKFLRLIKERDEFSQSVPSPTGCCVQECVTGTFSRKLNWVFLYETCKKWIQDPFNMALLLWIICVAISGGILFLVMTGMLNSAIPQKSQRNTWFEVNNQILNALFTLMCLYQHPKRLYHFILLCRWNTKDVMRLRTLYCKNGTYKPHEWAHIMVVVLFLHLNCFAQYALCSLNLGYRRSERPALGVAVCLSVAIASPAFATLYAILSPIGKDYDMESDEERQDKFLKSPSFKSSVRQFSFPSSDSRVLLEQKPEWRGGLLDIWDDISVTFLSLFCTVCVFGWNMERLGFGNMYVHMATFFLFCTAPFWIFDLAAVNIDNEFMRGALGVTGIVLCVFGLLYGGFWRIQIRKRYNLPSQMRICEEPGVGDCALWLFCCWCSLAQEVRTADYYDVMEDKFCRKQSHENETLAITPLPRENGLLHSDCNSSSPLGNKSRMFKVRGEESQHPSRLSEDCSNIEASYPSIGTGDYMKPPIPSVIRSEESYFA